MNNTIKFDEIVAKDEYYKINILPEWQRTYGISDDGELYVPAIMSGLSEEAVLIMAEIWGIPHTHIMEHLFVPSSWIESQFPCDKSEDGDKRRCLFKNIKEIMKDDNHS